MRWFCIRTADIPERDRELFERYGTTIIGAVLAGSSPRGIELQSIPASGKVDTAAKWLTEQYDRAERRETWLITMEAAITLFVFTEVVLSILGFFLNAIPP